MVMALVCPHTARGDTAFRCLVSLPCRDVTILGWLSQALPLSIHPTQPQSFSGMSWKRWDHP